MIKRKSPRSPARIAAEKPAGASPPLPPPPVRMLAPPLRVTLLVPPDHDAETDAGRFVTLLAQGMEPLHLGAPLALLRIRRRRGDAGQQQRDSGDVKGAGHCVLLSRAVSDLECTAAVKRRKPRYYSRRLDRRHTADMARRRNPGLTVGRERYPIGASTFAPFG